MIVLTDTRIMLVKAKEAFVDLNVVVGTDERTASRN